MATLKELTREVGGDPSYETAMRQATLLNRRVLTRTSRRMDVGDPHDTILGEYTQQLGPALMSRFIGALRRAHIASNSIQVHTSLTIPPHDRMEWSARRQFIKASPKQKWFSHIRIDAAGTEWWGRALVLFKALHERGHEVQRAFIQYYSAARGPCPDTGCTRLLPTSGRDAVGVIDVDSFLACAHIVPSFTARPYRLVNRFLF
ncbi:hypothetical protein CLOM_g7061 [Closterium sp. NIES-68]|nr:hypothetical protein CLOM_g7061 [Closterium sp. NIES-68]GJP60130.1 hypothetical protein CLOP_g17264 [Closterium sp. NIES-67]GJP76297.1 hypothetical protein CLOP_g6670 [Closterium sp. NIES-67]